MVGDSHLFGLVLSLLFGDLSLIKVDLVAHQHHETITVFVLVKECVPHFDLSQGLLRSHVEHYQSYMGVLKVTGN